MFKHRMLGLAHKRQRIWNAGLLLFGTASYVVRYSCLTSSCDTCGIGTKLRSKRAAYCWTSRLDNLADALQSMCLTTYTAVMPHLGENLLLQELRKRGVQTVGYTLIDHEGRRFLHDLLILQQSGLLQKGSVVVTDNILIPGAPEYRKHLASSPDFVTKEHVCRFSFSEFLVDIVTVSEYKGL